MRVFNKKISIILFLLILSSLSFAQESSREKSALNKLFVDTLDNKVDISNFLRTRYGFAFVPTIITEPALGYGGGGALIFIHRDPEEVQYGKGLYPSLSGAGGFYTESNSYALWAGHFGVWKNGTIRYRGGLGLLSANLDYYRTPIFENGVEKLSFNIKAYGLIQEIIFRLGDSDFLLGGSYGFAHTTVEFEKIIDLPEVPKRDYESNIGGLGIVLYYDTRDNLFSPNTGFYGGAKLIYYDKFLGSDRKFMRLFSHLIGYFELSEEFYTALRLDFQKSFDDIPFYLRPFISLRGVPAMRYQGETTYLAESETRWDITQRWSLVGFGGYGEALPVNDDLFDKQTAYNIGAGFRYLISRFYGIRMGIDVARGPEDWAFYIQFGSAWLRY